MTQTSIATAADYADTLLTARRAKNVLVALIALVLLAEMTVFFIARYTQILGTTGGDASGTPAQQVVLNYVLLVGGFVGLISCAVLSAVLLLMVLIMVVGRLLGAARVTSAFIFSLLLLALLFPWQSIFLNPTVWSQAPPGATHFIIPGVLYGWTELTHPTLGARFPDAFSAESILRWARFVGFPLVALVLVLLINGRSNRGLRLALGDSVVPLDRVAS